MAQVPSESAGSVSQGGILRLNTYSSNEGGSSMADVEDLNQSGKRVKSNNSSNEEDKEMSQSPMKGQSDSVNPFVSPETRGMTPIQEEDESVLRR